MKGPKSPRRRTPEQGANGLSAKQPLHVLLIGNTIAPEALERLLRRDGYEATVEEVRTRADMNAALRERRWGIIIGEFPRSHLDGLTALRLLKEKRIEVPFILVSAAIGSDIPIAAIRLGAADFVRDFDAASLVASIKRVLKNTRGHEKKPRSGSASPEQEK